MMGSTAESDRRLEVKIAVNDADVRVPCADAYCGAEEGLLSAELVVPDLMGGAVWLTRRAARKPMARRTKRAPRTILR